MGTETDFSACGDKLRILNVVSLIPPFLVGVTKGANCADHRQFKVQEDFKQTLYNTSG